MVSDGRHQSRLLGNQNTFFLEYIPLDASVAK